MKIALGSDHAGFRYKKRLHEYLLSAGYQIKDFGAYSSEESDYPVFIRPVAEAVGRGQFDRGIVLGGSGNGEAIVANRVPGVRCIIAWNAESARLGRAHNDSNVLSLGERMIDESQLLSIVDVWLKTPFDGGRHQRRIDMIDEKINSEPFRSHLLILGVTALLALCGCGNPKPMRIDSDPNLERQERVQDRVDQAALDAFLADHPELDEATKKAVRDGTMSPNEALRRSKASQKP